MTTRMALSLGLSALVLGGTMVGCTANGGGVASASDNGARLAAKGAAAHARKAGQALGRHQADVAVTEAEAAVALMPQSADYRALLGQSYLDAGRFESARVALGEALTLAPTNSHVALDLALAQTATGDWQGARATLAAHADTIPASDRGLALALAGDPAGGVALLTQAARQPGADVTTRQNLALAFALAGQWPMARAVAGADLAPAEVDRRIAEWMTFAQPKDASDQVAALLHTQAAPDAGRPAALALVSPVEAGPAATPVMTAAAEVPAELAPEARSPQAPAVAVAMAAPAPVLQAPQGHVVFGPRREVVQALPVRMIAAAQGPVKFAAADAPERASPADSKGDWYVQLGAYENAAVARDGWARATRRFDRFASYTPSGMAFSAGGDSFYRLSVGGFGRDEADAACRSYRARGGQCFVRRGAGDQTAQWARKGGAEYASR